MRLCLGLLCVAPALFPPLPAESFCSDPQPRLVCAEYFASQLVVEARLVQTRELHDKDDPEGISAFVFTLRVNEAFRGAITGNIAVYEGNDSGRATFRWVQGREYLLFLFYSANDKAWELDGCGNSGPLSKAKTALSEIAKIKASRGGGAIHGEIIAESPPAPLAGVRVEAQGTTGRYSTTTNEKGRFRLDVPPGRYEVRAVKNGFAFKTAEFSYEDPRNIEIESGGCAQVQLIAVDKSEF